MDNYCVLAQVKNYMIYPLTISSYNKIMQDIAVWSLSLHQIISLKKKNLLFGEISDFFLTVSHFVFQATFDYSVTQTGLKFMVNLLPQPPEF